MTTTFTDRARGYDFVKDEYEQRYTRVAGTIQNKTGGTIAAGAIKVGTPLNLNGTQWETIDAGSESGIDGFFVDNAVVPSLANNAITTDKYQILRCGPALINIDAISGDPDGTNTYSKADIKTRIAALNPPIRWLEEPDTVETQTT